MSGARRDRGSVSVELATALPAVVLVLALVLACVAWARDAVAVADAAALGARVAAVEGADAATAAVGAALPGARVAVTITADGSRVQVSVSTTTAAWLPDATASSVAVVTW